MKKNIHPKVRQVVFKDTSSDFSFLGTSTMDSKETIKWKDGKSYPLIRLEISSASHPFFTGKQRVHDAEGRIARFKKNIKRSELSAVKLRQSAAKSTRVSPWMARPLGVKQNRTS